ncbi:MAG: ACT domain-containing protein [Candidatus Omnitrophica bacterium]|nr:ACT domain-containing protein [Candidatus Omnitrophota bacterium]
MAVKTQLSVFLENRPGMLARACSILSDNGVNILALSIHDTVDHAVVRFYVDNPTKALLLIENEGFYVLEQEVVVLDVDNRPGSLTGIAQKLAEADINIHYAYCTATDGQVHGCLVLKTDYPDRADEVLTEVP